MHAYIGFRKAVTEHIMIPASKCFIKMIHKLNPVKHKLKHQLDDNKQDSKINTPPFFFLL